TSVAKPTVAPTTNDETPKIILFSIYSSPFYLIQIDSIILNSYLSFSVKELTKSTYLYMKLCIFIAFLLFTLTTNPTTA
ncbi:hypothetical protein, partial [Bacillus cereus]|uniref:hypothetical protein n=1 Tax=Bacillus cereus TaxID=1396 RepID=UPI0019D5AFE0